MSSSPAEILRQYLIDCGIVSNPDDQNSAEWPCYLQHLPDWKESQTNAVCIFNTAGRTEGRYHATGKVVERDGISILIRSSSFNTGYAKSEAVRNAVDAIRYTTVNVGGTGNLMIVFNRRQGILCHGQDGSDQRRFSFSLNGLLCLQ